MDFLLRRLMRGAVERGLAGDYLAWFGVAGAAWVFLRLRRRADPLVLRLPVSKGEQYLVTVRDPGPAAHQAT